MTREIGEIFQHGRLKLKAVESDCGTCYGCIFKVSPLFGCMTINRIRRDKSVTGECSYSNRSKEDDIIFILVKDGNN